MLFLCRSILSILLHKYQHTCNSLSSKRLVCWARSKMLILIKPCCPFDFSSGWSYSSRTCFQFVMMIRYQICFYLPLITPGEPRTSNLQSGNLKCLSCWNVKTFDGQMIETALQLQASERRLPTFCQQTNIPIWDILDIRKQIWW